MDKHTAGPWKIGYIGCYLWEIWGSDDSGVVDSYVEADAHLISAAPDLLFWAEKSLMSHESGIPMSMQDMERMGSAISKAKGEEAE